MRSALVLSLTARQNFYNLASWLKSKTARTAGAWRSAERSFLGPSHRQGYVPHAKVSRGSRAAWVSALVQVQPLVCSFLRACAPVTAARQDAGGSGYPCSHQALLRQGVPRFGLHPPYHLPPHLQGEKYLRPHGVRLLAKISDAFGKSKTIAGESRLHIMALLRPPMEQLLTLLLPADRRLCRCQGERCRAQGHAAQGVPRPYWEGVERHEARYRRRAQQACAICSPQFCLPCLARFRRRAASVGKLKALVGASTGGQPLHLQAHPRSH